VKDKKIERPTLNVQHPMKEKGPRVQGSSEGRGRTEQPVFRDPNSICFSPASLEDAESQSFDLISEREIKSNSPTTMVFLCGSEISVRDGLVFWILSVPVTNASRRHYKREPVRSVPVRAYFLVPVRITGCHRFLARMGGDSMGCAALHPSYGLPFIGRWKLNVRRWTFGFFFPLDPSNP
jgi:hypothetical protein